MLDKIIRTLRENVVAINIEKITPIWYGMYVIIDKMPRILTIAISLLNIIISGRQIPVPTPIKNLPIRNMKNCFAKYNTVHPKSVKI